MITDNLQHLISKPKIIFSKISLILLISVNIYSNCLAFDEQNSTVSQPQITSISDNTLTAEPAENISLSKKLLFILTITLAIVILVLLSIIRHIKTANSNNHSQSRTNLPSCEGFWDWDIINAELFFSDGCYTLLDFKPDEFDYTVTSWKERIHPDDIAEIETSFNRLINCDETTPPPNKLRIRNHVGEFINVTVSYRAINKDTSGHITRLLLIHTADDSSFDSSETADNLSANPLIPQSYISNSEHNQESITLNNNPDNMDVILESILSGIIVTDANGVITQVNNAALEILEKTKDNILNQHIADTIQLFESDTLFMIENPLLSVLSKQKHTTRNEPCIYITDNSIHKHLTVSTAPVNDPDNDSSGAILILFDNSEHFELEQNLRQSNKLKTLGKLAGGIAHDFNNLLGGIMGFADLICIHSKEEKITSFARNILDTTERAAELTSQLLSYSRKEHANIRQLNINECIEKATSILKHSIGTNITINTELAAKDAVIHADSTQIQSIIINLGINARDAMGSYGTLTIRTDDTMLSADYCSTSKFNITPGKFISITVSDTGKGISPEIIDHIFEPFFTTKETDKGTGLGLSALFNTVNAHNGAIEVESQKDIGTTFTIYLPHVFKIKLPEKQQTILLVEDEEIARSLGKSIIEECGYNVLIAENGEQALKMYLEKGHTIDLIIMDMVMPVMGGEEATRHLIKMNPNVKIILSSGMDRSNSIDELLLEGHIKDFIAKPFTSTDLMNSISKVL